MKRHHSPRGGFLMPSILACLSIGGSAVVADDIPKGTLTVDRSYVRVGVKSQLGWQITYPTTSVFTVNPDGTIIPKQSLKMRVRVLGVSFQSGSTLLPLQGSWSKNSSSWTNYFYGTGPTVVPTNILVDTTVNANDQIKFRGRGAANAAGTSWFAYHQTGVTDPYVVVLKNGDSPPYYAPAYSQGNILSFLAPYIDSTGKIKIGSQDLIVLMEASNASPGSTYFDMQDLVTLVTFE